MSNRLLATCILLLLLTGSVAAAGKHEHEHGAGHDHHHADGHGDHGVSKVGSPTSAGHAGKTIKTGTLRGILRKCGLDAEGLIDLL